MQIIEDGTDNATIDLESAAGFVSSLFTSSTDGNAYLVSDATKCLILAADESNNPLGKVGIRKNNPACAFDVSGDTQITGNVTISSSIRVGGNMTIGGNVTVVGSLTSSSSSQNNQYLAIGANYTGTASSTSGAFLTVNSATFTDIASTTGASYANFYANYIGAPSLATTATGVVATNASTLYISGAPTVSGTNDSILNAYSLNVNSGSSLFNAPVIVSNTNNLGSTNNIPTETTGALVVKGDVQLYGTKGAVFFNQGMSGGPPTFTTRSIGSRIVLYPQVASNSADHAIGVSSASSWYSSPSTLHYHRFYCGTTDVFDIVGSGAYLNTGNLYIQSAYLSTASGNDIYVNANASTVHLRPTAGSTNCELSVSTSNLTYSSTSGSTLLNIAADGSGATLSSPLSISNTLDSTSATSAASLGVSGGVSVAKSVFIGSNLSIGTNTTIGGNAVITGNASVSNNMTVGAMNVVNNLVTANLTTVNTTVSGNALVSGNAVISNNATIGGGSVIGGNAKIAGSASVLSTTDSTSATSAASLGVSGGVSVAKSVFIGSNLNVGSNTTIGGNALISGNATVSNNMTVGAMNVVNNLTTANLTTVNTTVSGNALVGGNAVISNNATIGGGAVIGGNASIAGSASVLNTVDSTSATSAASLGVSGGVSVAKSVFIGTNLNVGSNLNVGTNTTIGGNALITGNANISGNATVSNNMTVGAMNVVSNLTTANLTTVNTTVSGNALVSGNAVISNNATIGGGALIGGNASIAGSATVLSTTDSTSATSAASLGVSGGVSVAKSVFIGTNLNVGSNVNIGTNTTIGGNALIGGNTNILGSLSVTSFSPSSLQLNSSLSGTPSNGQHISNLSPSFLDTVTPTSGTLASWSDVYFGQPTLNATKTSVTTTTASTLYIAGAPQAGTNETITNAYSLNIGSGNSLFGGNLEVVNTLKVDNTTDVSATANGAVQVSGGVNVSKGLYLGYGLSSFSQDTGASSGWYILGLFTAGNAGSSRLKLELLGVSGYTANATAGGSTTLFMSVNSSTSTSGSTANCNGSYFCLGGTACVSSIKFVQNGSNRSSYYIYANLTVNSLHSVNATYRSGDSFVQQFTSTTDPGANSATVQQASNLMSVSSGLLGVGKSAGSSLAVGTGTGSRVLDLADSGATGRIRLTNSTATAALELIYNTTTSYIMTSGTDSRTYAYNGAGNALILQANEANTTIGSVGICKNNPSYPLDVAGNAHFGNNIYTDGVFSSTNTTALANTANALGPTLGAMVVAGDLLMQGAITGQIVWDQAKSGAFPTTTTRSAGTRLNLYPNMTSTQADHAIGVGPSTMWLSVPDNNHWISFYNGTQETVDIYGNGLMVGTTYVLENTSNTMNYTSGALVVMGDIQLYGSVGSLIFDQNKSVGTPTTTTRSAGSRIVLYPNVDATHCEHAMGIANNMSWYGVPTTSHYHKFYCGTSDVLDITGASVTVNTALNVTGDVGGAITTFATVVSQGTTVFSGTASSMSYWTMGKLAYFCARISYTGASSVQSTQKFQFTLPFTTAAFATAVNFVAISYRSTADCYVGITGSSAIATLYTLGTNATGAAYSAATGGDMVICQGLIKTA